MRFRPRPSLCSGWRRPAKVVELPSPVRIREHLVSLLKLLEFFLSQPVLRIEIRMIFPGKLQVGSSDLRLSSAGGYFKNQIIVRPDGHMLIVPFRGGFTTAIQTKVPEMAPVSSRPYSWGQLLVRVPTPRTIIV